jgi:hypothetical protein
MSLNSDPRRHSQERVLPNSNDQALSCAACAFDGELGYLRRLRRFSSLDDSEADSDRFKNARNREDLCFDLRLGLDDDGVGVEACGDVVSLEDWFESEVEEFEWVERAERRWSLNAILYFSVVLRETGSLLTFFVLVFWNIFRL